MRGCSELSEQRQERWKNERAETAESADKTIERWFRSFRPVRLFVFQPPLSGPTEPAITARGHAASSTPFTSSQAMNGMNATGAVASRSADA